MKLNIKIFIGICVFLFFISNALWAGQEPNISPVKSPSGKKWRIGYYQGGEYDDYQETLLETAKGLVALGWIKQIHTHAIRGLTANHIWDYLSTHAQSEYIEFVPDGYYSANWHAMQRKPISDKILKRIKSNRDIDLMIAMGTWAGQDLANNQHRVPTLVMSASDAVLAGIIDSPEDSGLDHVHAHVDPLRYERQVQIFHEIVGFKKLGVIYENTVSGRSYAAINKISKVARERDFEIISCYTASDLPDPPIIEKNYLRCFEELAQKADAVYVTIHGGATKSSIPQLAKIAQKYNIPTFSQSGSKEVQSGILMSLSRKDFVPIGRYQATVIARVLNGAKPREVIQVFEEPPDIALNLKTAELIGFYLSGDLIAAADKIYYGIEPSK
jgi:ABC-type uncharacterized transport system substrate-binding protein